MVVIDLDDVNEVAIYEAFNVDGNESEALNDSYLELFELIGRDAMLKLFKYFRGDKIDCPMRLYRPEFMERLGKIYWRDDGYRAALEREKEVVERLKETLTEEQMAMVEQYHIAISATIGICELLAYKQGMKDMVSILK